MQTATPRKKNLSAKSSTKLNFVLTSNRLFWFMPPQSLTDHVKWTKTLWPPRDAKWEMIRWMIKKELRKSNMIWSPAQQKQMSQEIMRERKKTCFYNRWFTNDCQSIKSLVTEPPSGLWTCSFFNSLIVSTSGHLIHPSYAFWCLDEILDLYLRTLAISEL